MQRKIALKKLHYSILSVCVCLSVYLSVFLCAFLCAVMSYRQF